ncbi:hypothetical protein HBB16_14210 [Pseudonocardia sp. MCCB 268]|nr:hypothetical protein [Pseudonocardia cytotoxica]
MCDSRVAGRPDDALAEPVPCVRCANGVLLTIVGRCADCISDLGRNHPDDTPPGGRGGKGHRARPSERRRMVSRWQIDDRAR